MKEDRVKAGRILTFTREGGLIESDPANTLTSDFWFPAL